MKMNEFDQKSTASTAKKPTLKVRNVLQETISQMATEVPPSPTSPPSPTTMPKNMGRAPAVIDEQDNTPTEQTGYSAMLPPGIKMTRGLARTRKHNPKLWAKITNWD
jgi:hypothetical protein